MLLAHGCKPCDGGEELLLQQNVRHPEGGTTEGYPKHHPAFIEKGLFCFNKRDST